MDTKALAASLHPLERKILPTLKQETDFSKIVEKSGMQEVEAMRAIQWLGNKRLVEQDVKELEKISLGKNAQKYVKEGLPEKKFLAALEGKTLKLSELKKKAKLDDNEANVCIGMLRRKGTIQIKKDKELSFTLTREGRKFLKETTPEETVLEKISKKQALTKEEEKVVKELKKRKDFIKTELYKVRTIKLTGIGKVVADMKLDTNMLDTVTREMIRKGSWKGKKFRKYDIKINVPSIERGKRHFVEQAIEYAKRVWLDLGFKEMTGNITQTEFRDLDTLFVPQDHPAREMQDTFFLGKNRKATLGQVPAALAKKIKAVHETGWTTGSTGWGGKWEKEIAQQTLLRTHTTVLSALKLAKLKKEDLPAKYFTIGRVYRNESLDWKHIFEFHQVEGIVVDPDANLRNLLGYLKEFFHKMGYPDVRIRPAFFGYVEPGAEIEVFHPIKKEWVELGGAGIFRPEVTKPLLGFECPVLAWGFGLERIITGYYGIHDIREVYKNDLKFNREIKDWMKL